jgi:Zn-dependent peptidase ImmA (M78 family)
MFERGFKSWCENVSAKVRKDLELAPFAPLPAASLARYLGVSLWSVDEITGLSAGTKNVLLAVEKANWSAVTVSFGGKDCVIYNPTHSDGRRSSDVMHELAHVFIGHPPATVFVSADGILALRSFNRTQEDEAAWLAGSLLLPRAALFEIAKFGNDRSRACQEYGVSDPLLTYRLNVTGVNAQLSRAKRSR